MIISIMFALGFVGISIAIYTSVRMSNTVNANLKTAANILSTEIIRPSGFLNQIEKSIEGNYQGQKIIIEYYPGGNASTLSGVYVRTVIQKSANYLEQSVYLSLEQTGKWQQNRLSQEQIIAMFDELLQRAESIGSGKPDEQMKKDQSILLIFLLSGMAIAFAVFIVVDWLLGTHFFNIKIMGPILGLVFAPLLFAFSLIFLIRKYKKGQSKNNLLLKPRNLMPLSNRIYRKIGT